MDVSDDATPAPAATEQPAAQGSTYLSVEDLEDALLTAHADRWETLLDMRATSTKVRISTNEERQIRALLIAQDWVVDVYEYVEEYSGSNSAGPLDLANTAAGNIPKTMYIPGAESAATQAKTSGGAHQGGERSWPELEAIGAAVQAWNGRLWSMSEAHEAVLQWITRATKATDGKTSTRLSELSALVTGATRLGRHSDSSQVLGLLEELTSHKRWFVKADAALHGATKLNLADMKALVAHGERLKLANPEMKELKNQIKLAKAWSLKRSKVTIVADGSEESTTAAAALLAEATNLRVDLSSDTAALSEATQKYCVCGRAYSGFMFACDMCEEWYHGPCVEMSEQDVNDLAMYVCPRCRVKQTLKVARQELTAAATQVALDANASTQTGGTPMPLATEMAQWMVRASEIEAITNEPGPPPPRVATAVDQLATDALDTGLSAAHSGIGRSSSALRQIVWCQSVEVALQEPISVVSSRNAAAAGRAVGIH